MAFNPLALLQEQQCSPIYTSLDSGDAEAALKQCDELVSKQPDLHLAIALKSIALFRIGCKREANEVADSLIKCNAASESKSVLQALCMTLSSLDRKADEVDVLEAASKANPNSIDIGKKSLTAMVKACQWQKAQQSALRLHKLMSAKDKDNDEYFWSSMQAYSLVADDPTLPGSKLALPLAQRMISKHLETRPFGPKSDEVMFLYATILRKLGGDHVKIALDVLNSEPRGKELCKRSMTLASLRMILLEDAEEWQVLYNEAIVLLRNGDENWTTIQQAVKAAIHLSQGRRSSSLTEIEKCFQDLAIKKAKNRSLRLAPLYLIKEVQTTPALSSQLANPSLLEYFTTYFNTFCTKACAFEDLSPYAVLLSEQERQSATQLLSQQGAEPVSGAFENLDSLYRNLNACKLVRLMQSSQMTTATSEEDAARMYFALYLCALPIGKDLPKTEMQPADEYALLASQSLIHASHLREKEGREEATHNLLIAVAILKAALIYSPKGYRLRVLLIRLLQQYSAIDLSRKEYEEIAVKSIQHDTLGWLIVNRASTSVSMLDLSSTEEQRCISTVYRLQSVWREGRTQVPQMVAKAFSNGIFSRVEELIEFGEKLQNSLTRWTMVVESARLSSSSYRLNLDWANELQQCALSIAHAKVSNQQDHDVLINLMPSACPDIAELTAIEAKGDPAIGYLKSMLPVAMLHVDVPLPEKYACTSEASELSEEELLLSRLSIKLCRQEYNDLTLDVVSLLDTALQSVERSHKPFAALHSASIALEAMQLICKAKQRATSLALDETRLSLSLTALVDTIEAKSWVADPRVSQDWLTLLGKLPAALRQGRNAQDVLNSQAKELNLQSMASKAALLQRMRKALSGLNLQTQETL